MRVKIQYPDYYDENNILQDGTQIVDTHDDKELQKVLKEVYEAKQVNHVHLEFGFYDESHNFVYTGEVVIPFKKDVTPCIVL